jgi:tetratricopeptide (TPR) repeat protein
MQCNTTPCLRVTVMNASCVCRYVKLLTAATDTTDPANYDEKADVDLNLMNVLAELCMRNSKHRDCLQVCKTTETFLKQQAARDGQEEVEELPLDLLVKRGISFLLLGQSDLATAIFERVWAEDIEDYGDLCMDIADAYFSLKDYERVEALLKKVEAEETWHTPTLWQLQAQLKVATCKGDEQMLHEAGELYEACLESDPKSTVVRVALSEIYTALGDRTKALAIVQTEGATPAASNLQQLDHEAHAKSIRALWIVPAAKEEVLRDAESVDMYVQKAKVCMQSEDYLQFATDVFHAVKSTAEAYMGSFRAQGDDDNDSDAEEATTTATPATPVVVVEERPRVPVVSAAAASLFAAPPRASTAASLFSPASSSSSSAAAAASTPTLVNGVSLPRGVPDVSSLITGQPSVVAASPTSNPKFLSTGYRGDIYNSKRKSWKAIARPQYRTDGFTELMDMTCTVLSAYGLEDEVVKRSYVCFVFVCVYIFTPLYVCVVYIRDMYILYTYACVLHSSNSSRAWNRRQRRTRASSKSAKPSAPWRTAIWVDGTRCVCVRA